MGNGIINKIKTLFNKKKNENEKEIIKSQNIKMDSKKNNEQEVNQKSNEKQISKVNNTNENNKHNTNNTHRAHSNRANQPKDKNNLSQSRNDNTRKSNKGYNDSRDKKKTYNHKNTNERKVYDKKTRDNKYSTNSGKVETENNNFTSEIENLIKDITIGMVFESENFKGEIIKKQSHNLSYSIGNKTNILTYREIIESYIKYINTGSIEKNWYESNFKKNTENSNLSMIKGILNKYISKKQID
ncbi:hypothetical protein [Oceanirhabdus sp. W0125-5]|uniref:hypothetical protein n=1 Tax=Oceanirhabdus sp. W0125-5 TaxID=2999116 RepID=UPI0022F32FA6|nr:hypothetical protein [Oceanirhabdus sp. W0125-5]WBW94687.1 hypothetical protein OW730_13375 [Oceanirhabdus sp. W0125-5]